MTTYDTIIKLCDREGIAVTALESMLGFGRGSIGKLKTGGDITATRLNMIAQHFGVTVDYLINGEEKEVENEKSDIAIDLSDVLKQLKFSDGLMFDGLDMDDDARKFLINSLESSIKNAKLIAKSKEAKKKE